ncbi:MAG TPA: sugar nucleotide-binding protein [Vicinamibacterales bacterium]|nr:sugar nucleotide-binding protein [Vicinamibacterales bacterium]
MRVLVIGASGFVGRHILRGARAAGHESIGTQSIDRGGELLPFDLARDRLSNRVPQRWLEAGPFWVIIAGAIPQPERCRAERDLAFATNVSGTMQAIRDAVSLGAIPVFLSSSFVFDGKRGGYGDHDARAPISEYGRHKARVEEFIEQEVPTALTLRLDKMVSDDPTEHHLLSEWWGLGSAGVPIRCVADQDFSVTLVDDVARGVLCGCERHLSGTYNLASPQHFLRLDLAKTFLEMAGFSVPVFPVSQAELGFSELRSEKSWLDSSAFVRATELTFTNVHTVCASFLDRVRHHFAPSR